MSLWTLVSTLILIAVNVRTFYSFGDQYIYIICGSLYIWYCADVSLLNVLYHIYVSWGVFWWTISPGAEFSNCTKVRYKFKWHLSSPGYLELDYWVGTSIKRVHKGRYRTYNSCGVTRCRGLRWSLTFRLVCLFFYKL